VGVLGLHEAPRHSAEATSPDGDHPRPALAVPDVRLHAADALRGRAAEHASLNRLIRHRLPEDDSFLISSWVHSSLAADNHPQTDGNVLARRKLVRDILAGPRVAVLVCVPDDDASTILGWLCSTDRRLDYVYVRGTMRREGICRSLCASAFGTRPFSCDRATPRWKAIAGRLGCALPQGELTKGAA
jgi:hypothetical protein